MHRKSLAAQLAELQTAHKQPLFWGSVCVCLREAKHFAKPVVQWKESLREAGLRGERGGGRAAPTAGPADDPPGTDPGGGLRDVSARAPRAVPRPPHATTPSCTAAAHACFCTLSIIRLTARATEGKASSHPHRFLRALAHFLGHLAVLYSAWYSNMDNGLCFMVVGLQWCRVVHVPESLSSFLKMRRQHGLTSSTNPELSVCERL